MLSNSAAKALEYARQRAVADAWKMERQMVKNGNPGSVNWTAAQRKELLEKGKVSGYEGDHINTVNGNVELAADHRNIQFLTEAAHTKRHQDAGGYRVPISGEAMIDRTLGGALPDLATPYAKSWSDTAYDLGISSVFAAGVALEILDFGDPLFGPIGIFNPGDGAACATLDCP